MTVMSTTRESQARAELVTGEPTIGLVLDAPRAWLRLEGLALLTAAIAGFAWVGETWWLFGLLLLAPDLSAVGYVFGRSVGARVYNAAHAMPVPLALAVLGVWTDQMIVVALSLTWLAHIGLDRAMSYGLKYPDHPGHTHLGWHGPVR